MKDFSIKKDTDKISSVNRTVRFKPESFDKLMDLSEKYQISFGKVVNQCVEYALENLKEE